LGTYISFAVIIVVALLVASILMQVRGAGGGLFGAGSIQSYRTRRGVERTLFQFTIGLGVIFVILAILNLTIT
jgi:preprotein translocase subunit SecG